jgi:metallo-beta-lactamase family protein
MPHHLKLYLDHPQNHLLIIAYQAQGSLGRKLYDGARSVMIEGQKIKVKARVTAIGAYSSHADQPKLINWVKKISRPKPQKFFVIHGEKENNNSLASLISHDLKVSAEIPQYGKVYNF